MKSAEETAVYEDVVEGFRLSPQQERVWLLRQGAGGAAYRCRLVVHVEGRVEPEALGAAFGAAAERHEILRTRFRHLPAMGVPVQVIGDESTLRFETRDLSGLGAEEQARLLGELCDGARPLHFDVERGPLALAELVRLAPERHALVLTASALCADSAALRDLAAEVAGLYGARDFEGSDAAEAMQYADLAEWLNEMLEGEEGEAGRQFWRAGKAPENLNPRLAFEAQEDAAGDFRPRAVVRTVEPALARALREAAAGDAEEMKAALFACWQILQWRLTGQPRTVACVLDDGRKYDELRRALGLFSKALPVTVTTEAGATFGEVRREAAEALRAARGRHEFFSWELVAGSHPEAAGAFCAFGFDFATEGEALVAAHEAVWFSVGAQDDCLDRFKVKLVCRMSGEALTTEIVYDSALLDESDAARLLEEFRVLLADALSRPGVAIEELECVGEAERRQLLRDLNDTRADFGPALCLHEMFEAQAAASPDATALVYDDRRMTFGELDARANRLANYLRAAGVVTESLVGVCVERSPEMVVALLGVLKAGGAYMPLDPLYPADRLDFMLADAGVDVLVKQEHVLNGFDARGVRVVTLEREREAIAAQPATKPASDVKADSLAYVIYTSGSTGRPKGVMISHRAIGNRLLWMEATFPLEAADGVFQKTPFSFDASVWELFVPLMSGARMVLARPQGHQDSAYLVETIAAQGVTVLQLVPSMLQVFLDEPGLAGCASLRRLYCGGELLPASSRERLYARTSAVELINLYGPTECSIDATFWHCRRDERGAVVPIGRPISNMRVYLLDRGLRPVPFGASGELYVGGTGLSRGYLGRPTLTAERFVPDPFSVEPGARLYRTGDVARYGRGGALEFLGRGDQQVKVRGFRIELGEIEDALARHEAVREAVVVAREQGEGDLRLVAYWTPSAATSPAPPDAEFRSFVQQTLPDYMLPSVFVRLEALPRTPNGKIDRLALPAPEQVRGEAARDYEPPRGEAEERLAMLWGELLGVERVGVNDDFFALGGHSLLATRLVSRLREAFGVEVPLRAFFEAPTVAQLAELVESHRQSPESRGGAAARPPVVATPREGNPPLSFAQQRLWFLDQLEGESAAYNMATAVRLKGRLDGEALAASLAEIVRRHETLRTRFEVEGGAPVQVISAESRLGLEVEDLRDLGAAEREARAREVARDEARTRFDLARGPLVRAKLLMLDEDEHVLLVTMHHIVSDGWSMGVFVRELTALYEAFMKGEPSPLPELTVQYADYAAWQREWLQGEVLAGQLDYWREELAGAPELLELPTDHARPAVQSFRGETLPLALPKELADALADLGRREGATVFMTLLAAFAALLHRYSGQEEILVGTPVAGRQQAETEGLIGLFINTLVLRARLADRPTFRELLGRVRETALGGAAHGDVPFERLVEELRPGRSLSHTPLFQVLFIYQNAARETFELPGLSLGALEVESGTAKFDLTLSLVETDEGLSGSLEYNRDLFEAETVGRLGGHFIKLLEGAVAAPDERIARLPLLTEGERAEVLRAWNETGAEYPRDTCLHELFEAQAAAQPEAPAVRFERGEWLSYGELNARADRLARRLRALGVAAESRVGIYLERSVGALAALLGVLKAGGAYVPLDPSYPRERVAFMLEDAGLSVLITEEALRPTLPPLEAAVLSLDAVAGEGDAGAGERGATPAADGPADVSGANAAYVIYTSGSTGRPKGVVITHEAVVNFLHSMASRPGLGAADTLLAVTSLSFDIAALELFLPLAVGARLVLAGREAVADGRELRALLEAGGVTAMQATPSTWGMLLQAGWENRGGLKILCGGEALPRELKERLLPSAGLKLWNMYGPTETTIWSAVSPVASDDERITIGRPINNTQIYLLDADHQPVPVGVAGDLYIGGEGLARGYLNRPALTAERFVPDPFSAAPGARVYRTGDLARYTRGGAIEFLGRGDQQVKVRGFRIELGEIESALAQHPSVERAVALSHETAPGEKILVAYLTTRAGASPPAQELRAFLRERLPDYMLPSAFVVLDAMPLTPNGKIDRKALPAPDASRADSGAGFQAPRTPAEELMAAVWSDVLRVESVGVHDNFFDLGGHSLLATQLISRVRQLLGVELPMRRLFETPTVAGLAEACESLSRSGAGDDAPPLVPVPREGELPLSFAQQRLWFLDQLTPNTSTFNIPVAVRLSGRLDVPALERAFRTLVARHETLRTSFAADRGRPVLKVAPPEVIDFALEVSEVGGADGARREAEARRLLEEEAQRPFELARAPLLRARLLRLGEEEHVLQLTMHHIVSDGWSMGVVVREVATLYEAFVKGEESPLAELKIQYADYAAWQRGWLQGETLERLLAYWRTQLAGAPPVLELPADRPRPDVRTFRGAMHKVHFPRELLEELTRLGRGEGVTLFMILLGAFQVLLRHHARREDMVVGTDVANRNRLETEDLVGFFVNQLVLRTSLAGDPSFSELLGRVRETTLGAYAHQDLPFEQLVDTLRPERNLRHAPLFQVKLVLQNHPMGDYELPGLRLSPAEVESVAAKFDLTLLLGEEPGGLGGYFEYNADLFDEGTIARFGRGFEAVLRGVCADPQARLGRLAEILAAQAREEQSMETTKREESSLKRLKGIKPKPLSVEQGQLVRTEEVAPGAGLPLVIRPALRDVDLISWTRASLPFVEERLYKHGALLFRGFRVESAETLEAFASLISPELFSENGEHPRQSVSGNVYTPVFYPSDQHLLWHNENSFNHRWPTKIWFCCLVPPADGGETPVADSRRVYAEIDPAIRRRFVERGVMYVRNYSRELGLDWETVFRTSDRAAVEEQCRRQGMVCEWKSDNRLRTRCVRPAVVLHPRTGEPSWFNQAQHWHVSCLDPATRESVLTLFKEEDFPRNCYYGDGSAIADEEMRSILDVYARLEVSFPWERGDVMMLDNILAAHGRNRFRGERKLLVTMGEMRSYEEVAVGRD